MTPEQDHRKRLASSTTRTACRSTSQAPSQLRDHRMLTPVLARLWRPRHTGKIAHARELAELIAARYPNRTVHVVGDAAYVGERLRDVDGRITWTSRLKVTSVLHELPPPRTGRSGRPRTRGARLGTPTDLAAAAVRGRWRDTRVAATGVPMPCRSP